MPKRIYGPVDGAREINVVVGGSRQTICTGLPTPAVKTIDRLESLVTEMSGNVYPNRRGIRRDIARLRRLVDLLEQQAGR